jgi:hypothetical protein
MVMGETEDYILPQDDDAAKPLADKVTRIPAAPGPLHNT